MKRSVNRASVCLLIDNRKYSVKESTLETVVIAMWYGNALCDVEI